ncbi:hypothetical protein GP486_006587 [Trichoglossum hirsutum]|uniref:Xylanolytic transcriptional activator regulatory domain-containing protein n=1 Tax=Trichoglossum hirsutum TaxID=265104 RepID=A0A9P8L3J7_9PEZI|nr:hypothetical protein GP486_006587 [Trichoglossum hirsutum]
MTDMNTATPPPETTLQSGSRSSGKAANKRETVDMEELVSDFGYMSVNATTRDFFGFTTMMSFSRLVLSACTGHSISPSSAMQLPPRYSVMPLIHRYLSSIFAILPFFPETSIFMSIDAVYQNKASDFDHWTVNMILAIACSLHSRRRGDTEYKRAEGYVAAALTRADEVLTPGSITGIQAILLLVVYAMLDPAHFDSWYLIGIASRATVDIGLHHEPPKQAVSNKAQLDKRRRVFYCVHALDRSISMVHARAFSFTDESTNVFLPSLPTKSSAYGSPTVGQIWQQPLDFALHLFRLRQLQSSWYQELFQSGRTPLPDPDQYIFGVCDDMRKWAETIPATVSAPIREQFELEALYSYIYALAPTRRSHTISDTARILTFEYCTAYAEKLLPIARNRENAAFYTSHDALRVYFLGNLFIATLRENEEILLDGVPPTLTYIPGPNEPPIPPLPNQSRMDNTSRAINCINQMTGILETYGSRWEQATAMRDTFKDESAPVLTALRQRVGRMTASPEQNNTIPYFEQEQMSALELAALDGGDEWRNALPEANGTDLLMPPY